MTIEATEALVFFVLTLPICIWVAWNDMKFMKIPNKAVIALGVIFLIVGLFLMPITEYGWRLVQLVGVLAIGFVLNIIRAVGAGDAKFAAAAAPFIPSGDGTLVIYLFAAVLLVAFAVHRIARNITPLRNLVPEWKSWEVREFPMGLALGSTLAFYLLLGAAFGS
ncbi:MAG: prepilin peptidase [Paracoccaceae bacterium]|nr:prepilin peptidase [Paracoccaceae bacterium]